VGLEDLERIYVDLENLEASVDALAFEANVFTAGLTFAALRHAYIRLVNADTNQEASP
jgi:stress response protein SCP2